MLSQHQSKVNAVSVNVPARKRIAITLLCSAMIASTSLAQNGRPEPERPANQNSPEADTGPATDLPQPTTPLAPTSTRPNRTRPVREGNVVLAFNETPLEEIIPFIVEATGKVVMPINLVQLKAKKITVINDEPVSRAAALDLIISALQLNGVGVIETDEVVILDTIDQIKLKATLPVFGPADDIMNREDIGQYIVKIYRLTKTAAEPVSDKLQDNLPEYATVSSDINSNQIILYGTVGLAQHYQRIINNLDQSAIEVETKTYVLDYADAQAIADQIIQLFEPSGETSQQTPGAPRQRNNNRQQRQPAGGGGNAATATPAGTLAPGPVVELRVSVNVSQNAVTVTSDPPTIREITKLVNDYWDLPRPQETAKVYHLKHTDPLKVEELLLDLLGQGSSSRTGRAGGGAGGAQGRAQQAGGGAGGAAGGGSISEAIGDIYRIRAYPDQNKIVVLSKTKDALNYLDGLIEEIDQPSTVGLPEFVELKHANAVSLAKELNVLLAEAGTGGGLETPDEGLTGQGFDMTSGEGASGTTGGRSDAGGGATGGGGSVAGMM